MKNSWQRRSLKLRLTVWYAAATTIVPAPWPFVGDNRPRCLPWAPARPSDTWLSFPLISLSFGTSQTSRLVPGVERSWNPSTSWS